MKLQNLMPNANIVIATNSKNETVSHLFSYETEVARYNHDTNEVKVLGWWSITTSKHINAFLEYYGFDKMTKKEMLKS